MGVNQNNLHKLQLISYSLTYLARRVPAEEETARLAHYRHPGYLNRELLNTHDIKVNQPAVEVETSSQCLTF